MEDVIRNGGFGFEDPQPHHPAGAATFRVPNARPRTARHEAEAALVSGAFLLGLIASRLAPVLWTLWTG